MKLSELIPSNWRKFLVPATETESFKNLELFLEKEWETEQIFPPKEKIFSALKITPFESVKVVILGQDPYHDDNQAHGLSFSVPPGQKIPPSLRNILKELESDIGTRQPDSGYLIDWAKQGVLLVNTVLTVRAHQANSHSKKGWEDFTDSVIKLLSDKKDPVIFVLWGASAQKKAELIDQEKNQIISSAHPSPLSAHRGFFGSKPFSKINDFLKENGQPPINWQLPTSMLF